MTSQNWGVTIAGWTSQENASNNDGWHNNDSTLKQGGGRDGWCRRQRRCNDNETRREKSGHEEKQ